MILIVDQRKVGPPLNTNGMNFQAMQRWLLANYFHKPKHVFHANSRLATDSTCKLTAPIHSTCKLMQKQAKTHSPPSELKLRQAKTTPNSQLEQTHSKIKTPSCKDTTNEEKLQPRGGDSLYESFMLSVPCKTLHAKAWKKKRRLSTMSGNHTKTWKKKKENNGQMKTTPTLKTHSSTRLPQANSSF